MSDEMMHVTPGACHIQEQDNTARALPVIELINFICNMINSAYYPAFIYLWTIIQNEQIYHVRNKSFRTGAD